MTEPRNQQEKTSSPLAVLRGRDFRLLWIGEGISVLGDQFYMIALPWLVLQLTNGNALATGMVLAIAGIPRALFMLLGGALTDRFSPRTVMLGSNVLRLGLVALLSVLIFTGLIELWMLYVFALVFGLVDAFFFPASGSIVPQLVDKEHLQAGNAIIQGTVQLSLFAGPVLAGAMIALLGGSADVAAEGVAEAVPEMSGIGIAFIFDALTFLLSTITLWMMRVRSPEEDEKTDETESVLSSIREGLVYVWNDVALRSFFFLIAASNLLINGPMFVGIPVLADTRLPEGAAAFGVVMSAFGGGMLIGTILSGVLPRPSAKRMGILLIAIWSGTGVAVALFGLVSSTPIAALLALAMGMANGYVVIIFVTWLQSRTPQAMLGRMMSLLMFASAGLVPVSQAATGALIELNMKALFLGAGGLMAVITLLSLLNPAMRSLEEPEVVSEPLTARSTQEVHRATQEMRIVG